MPVWHPVRCALFELTPCLMPTWTVLALCLRAVDPFPARQARKGSKGPGACNGAADAVGRARPGAALAAWRRLAAPVARLLSPALRRTSLLLLLIWFTNALAYYGLVLLTTTVRRPSFSLSGSCLGYVQQD